MALHVQTARLRGVQACHLRSSPPRAQQQQQPLPPLRRRRLPSTAEQPQLNRRRLLSIVPLPLLFLPWSGCDQGGNYSTGVKGTPGKDCQVIYQPAAAAEKRFAEQQRQRQQQAAQQQQQQQPEAPRPAAASEREERATLRKEQAAYDRQAMAAVKEASTRALVDSMWQGLE